MKKYLFMAVMAALAISLTSCGNKKKSDDIIAPKVVKVKPRQPVRMQEYRDVRDVTWVEGRRYHVEVLRQAGDSLPMVKDEIGQEYVDNKLLMTVTRSDGSVFFERSFTKKDFLKYINDDYQKTGILEGIVFDKVDGDYLLFGASVAHPGTDEYIPLVVKLSRMGELTVKEDTQMDTGGESLSSLTPEQSLTPDPSPKEMGD